MCARARTRLQRPARPSVSENVKRGAPGPCQTWGSFLPVSPIGIGRLAVDNLPHVTTLVERVARSFWAGETLLVASLLWTARRGTVGCTCVTAYCSARETGSEGRPRSFVRSVEFYFIDVTERPRCHRYRRVVFRILEFVCLPNILSRSYRWFLLLTCLTNPFADMVAGGKMVSRPLLVRRIQICIKNKRKRALHKCRRISYDSLSKFYIF